MKRLFMLVVFSLAVFAAGLSSASERAFHLVLEQGEVEFEGCAPGNLCEKDLRIFLQDVHESWAVLVFAEVPGKSEPILPCLSLEGPGVTIENLSAEARKFFEGRGSAGEDLFVDARLRLEPDWAVPPGEYTLSLFFQYLPETGEPEEPPFPLKLKITVPPEVKLTLENGDGLCFSSRGSPGLYPLEGTLTLRGRSNAEVWRVVLYSEDLRGKKGGFIPASRIFKKQGKKYLPLASGFEMGPFPGGEEVEITIDELYVETLLEDQPDTYEGKLYFRCFFKE